jgi:hypothetical protein
VNYLKLIRRSDEEIIDENNFGETIRSDFNLECGLEK